MKICIDPGHGGTDPGAIGTAPAATGEPALTLKECDFTLDVALLLEEGTGAPRPLRVPDPPPRPVTEA